jgi:DNA-directed RNA polymerase II subunit RPB1
MDIVTASVSSPAFWRDEVVEKMGVVKDVQLHILDSNTIKRNSVCQVTTTTLYEKSLPRPWGVNDVRMGPVDRKVRCSTCSNNMVDCTGHWGHMDLAAAVYHISYMSYIVKTLRCICPVCYRLVMTDKVCATIKKKFQNNVKLRFDALTSYLKNRKRCLHLDCKAFLPKYKQVSLVIKREWLGHAKIQFQEAKEDEANPEAPPNSKRQKTGIKKRKTSDASFRLTLTDDERAALTAPLTPQLVRDMFGMVDKEVFISLGLEEVDPSSFIIKTLLVPPPIIRPAIMFSESSRTRGQDDLTHKLQEILKTSQKLDKVIEKSQQQQYPALFEHLQLLVATYINNETLGLKATLKKRSGLPFKSVVQRFRGKKGRLRGNCMGKRVNFSSRTVISPDAVMDVDEIGVPYIIAKKLTFKERVFSLNIQALGERVRLGHDSLKGARSIIKTDGTQILLEYATNPHSIRLQLGWQVERYLQDGDYVLFNRQPSLRKNSVMAHRVKLMPGKTFRLNLSCTGAYNGNHTMS